MDFDNGVYSWVYLFSALRYSVLFLPRRFLFPYRGLLFMRAGFAQLPSGSSDVRSTLWKSPWESYAQLCYWRSNHWISIHSCKLSQRSNNPRIPNRATSEIHESTSSLNRTVTSLCIYTFGAGNIQSIIYCSTSIIAGIYIPSTKTYNKLTADIGIELVEHVGRFCAAGQFYRSRLAAKSQFVSDGNVVQGYHLSPDLLSVSICDVTRGLFQIDWAFALY